MKIAIYLSAVPKNKNQAKLEILKSFGKGALINNDEVVYVEDSRIVPCDVAIMQGFVHKDVSSPHLHLRKCILENHENIVIIDSNLFQFADKNLANYYLRYSLNGIFPNTGFYFDNLLDKDRWTSIQKRLNLNLKEYNKTGSNILLCLQRIDGWSMCEENVQYWLEKTVAIISKFSNRKIIIRRHPGDRRQSEIKLPKNCEFSYTADLLDDLKNAWVTITYNSSPGVASLLNGVPVFVTDPEPRHSQTYPLCNLDLTTIENPVYFDRTDWIIRLAQSHWNLDEVSQGKAWEFMKKRLKLLKPNLC